MSKCECKECVHFDMCDWLDREYGLAKADNCHFAKDKSLFVELPCKCGDTVFYLNRYYDISLKKDNIYEAKVTRIVLLSDTNEICIIIQIKDEWGTTEVPSTNDLGKTLFLTKEEAEQKLKELENGK